MVRSIAIENQGQWLASGTEWEEDWCLMYSISSLSPPVSSDNTLRLWEVDTGRCVKVIVLPGTPSAVEFITNTNMTLISLAL